MNNFNDLMGLVYRSNSIDFSKVENFNLGLNKLIKLNIIENTRLKSQFLNGFIRFGKYKFYNPVSRINEEISSLKNAGYKEVVDSCLQTSSRLVIGLGSSHVLETALTLHHIFGIPYIPGSALKGVCRSVAFWKLVSQNGILNNENELNNLQRVFYGNLIKDKEILKYQLLFGAQDFKGLLLFLDAYPILNENENIFDLDIMNVHYPSYYGSGEPPGDWENPNPIVFLTVKPGVRFRIVVLFDEWRWNKIKNEEPYRSVDLSNVEVELREIIKKALEEFGVGAKTRLGYGILI